MFVILETFFLVSINDVQLQSISTRNFFRHTFQYQVFNTGL